METGCHFMDLLSCVILSLAMSLKLVRSARIGVSHGRCLCPVVSFCGVVWAVTCLRKFGVSTDMGEVVQH